MADLWKTFENFPNSDSYPELVLELGCDMGLGQ